VEEGSGAVAAVTSVAPKAAAPAVSPAGGATEVKAQIPGNVYEILCSVGSIVKAGETLVILEAMKMETPVVAPSDGTIASLDVQKGQTVKSGQLIATIA
jgi:biotin carboxyl carrier protein